MITALDTLDTFDSLLNNLMSKNPRSIRFTDNDDGYLLEMIAPGLTKEDVNIELKNNTLIVKAIRNKEWISDLYRQIDMPNDADVSAISASLELGILSINIPIKKGYKNTIKIE